jgi:sugar lactone lactonase YvrE
MRPFVFRLAIVLLGVLLVPAELRADILYVSDPSAALVYQVNTAMTPGGTGTNNPIPSTTFNTPEGLALDRSGNLYVADASGSPNQVYLLTRGAQGSGFLNFGNLTQNPTAYATGGSINGPEGITFDKLGNLYIANLGSHALVQVTSPTTTGGNTLTTALSFPSSVAVSPITGFVYVGAPIGSGVSVFQVTGSTATLKGTISTGVYNSQGLTFDQAGNLYISEVANGNPSRVAQLQLQPDGVTVAATNNNYGGGALTNPQGLAFDQMGNLYIADQGVGNVVRVAAGSPGVSTVFASGYANPQFLAVFATPEPSSLALLSMAASAMAGYGWWGRRRRRSTDTSEDSAPLAPESGQAE